MSGGPGTFFSMVRGFARTVKPAEAVEDTTDGLRGLVKKDQTVCYVREGKPDLSRFSKK
jgi:hypothetical protein